MVGLIFFLEMNFYKIERERERGERERERDINKRKKEMTLTFFENLFWKWFLLIVFHK